MRGARLTAKTHGQVRPDRLALKPYWGKPNVRNFRGSDGNGGIIRSPVRAIALPDFLLLYCKQFGDELTLIPNEWVERLAQFAAFPKQLPFPAVVG